ncbi:MAG TPA: BadF/BadG/BcrA/BcrD ATPase family protein, partial [Abditibacteriaceae bacterium]
MIRVGIDGGGTTTRAVLIDEDFNVLGRGEAGSSNHYSVGVERAIDNIRRAVDGALSQAHVLED